MLGFVFDSLTLDPRRGSRDSNGGIEDTYLTTHSQSNNSHNGSNSDIQSSYRSASCSSIYTVQQEDSLNSLVNLPDGSQDDKKHKFGSFSMVFIPTFMNLLGTAMYLRMGIMTGQSGIILALVQVLIATVILCVTVLSISALCSNGRIKGGGFYFLISRSLGPEIGTTFGCIYFLTNAIMVAFSIVGVCIETQYILQEFKTGIVEMPSNLNDQRIVGLISLFVVSLIPFISLDFEAKTQWILFFMVIVSLLDFFIGEFLLPNNYQKSNGFVGWDQEVCETNLKPLWDGYYFFGIFGIFTSAIAGDFTGATMATSLRNPSTAIPKGSLWAVIITSVIYCLQIIFFGCTSVRYSSGKVSDTEYNNYTCNPSQSCSFGLSSDQYLMSKISALTTFGRQTHNIEPLFATGLLAQSLSAAMSSFISAPRILQSLGSDGVIPFLKWFAKPYGKHSDPRRGYALTFVISLIFIAIINFDIIANIVSNCYLFAWSLVNLSCFHSAYVQSCSWRPSFKYYNKWLSLFCSIVCLVLMFCFDWISSLCLIAITAIVLVVIFCNKRKQSIWGQTSDSQLYKTSVSLAHKLNMKTEDAKNFRPSIMLLSGNPKTQIDLISMANQITRHTGMLMVSDIATSDLLISERHRILEFWNHWLKTNKIKAFYNLTFADKLSDGCSMMIQCSGLGSYLCPNIIMMGFKDSWKQSKCEDVIDYFNCIHLAFQLQKSVIIYRNYKKSKAFLEKERIENQHKLKNPLTPRISYQRRIQAFDCVNDVKIMRMITELDFIDIFWLHNDGGLTLLIAYVISQRKDWRKCKIRVFIIVDNNLNECDSLEKMLCQTMKDLRIECYDICVEEMSSKPFYHNADDVIEEMLNSNNFLYSDLKLELKVLEELQNLEEQTNKYLVLKELIAKHSTYSSLIIVTLEIPENDSISAHFFMNRLDLLSSEMPQFLFIRANGSKFIN